MSAREIVKVLEELESSGAPVWEMAERVGTSTAKLQRVWAQALETTERPWRPLRPSRSRAREGHGSRAGIGEIRQGRGGKTHIVISHLLASRIGFSPGDSVELKRTARGLLLRRRREG